VSEPDELQELKAEIARLHKVITVNADTESDLWDELGALKGEIEALVAKLPRYREHDIEKRPSMHEYIDAEQLDEELAALLRARSPQPESCSLEPTCMCQACIAGRSPQPEQEHADTPSWLLARRLATSEQCRENLFLALKCEKQRADEADAKLAASRPASVSPLRHDQGLAIAKALRGEISHGRLAEILGIEDVHAFKLAAGSFDEEAASVSPKDEIVRITQWLAQHEADENDEFPVSEAIQCIRELLRYAASGLPPAGGAAVTDEEFGKRISAIITDACMQVNAVVASKPGGWQPGKRCPTCGWPLPPPPAGESGGQT
jgi:hypothetical protein